MACQIESDLAENAFNIGDGDAIDLRHLGGRHAVFHPDPDAGKFRAWNLARCRL